MLLHILLAAEIMTALVCIYCIYGERFRLDRKTIVAFLGILIILEIVNSNQLNGIFTFLGYVILFAYCMAEFKSSIVETAISIILCIVIVTSMQSICVIFANMLWIDAEYARDAVSNIMSLAVFIILLSTDVLHNIKESICQYSKFFIILLVFMSLTILAILLQGKYFSEVHMQYFVLVIPTFIMLLYVIFKWYAAQSEAERMKEWICAIEGNEKSYEHLLTKVRLRQHALKNHMEAIFSFHYTYKTYEKLVQVEEDYCNQLLKENRYNDLLLLGDNVLVGYLCGKFQGAEDDGIEIDYRITSEISQCRVPIYYVIEMLGILFDNAMEALNGMSRKEIFFAVCEADDKYEFLIRNPFPYVPYDDIGEWFGYEKSGKGNGRGLGLYHLKCLCEEWNCDVGCRNMEINEENWIVFYVRIGKADST